MFSRLLESGRLIIYFPLNISQNVSNPHYQIDTLYIYIYIYGWSESIIKKQINFFQIFFIKVNFTKFGFGLEQKIQSRKNICFEAIQMSVETEY